VKIGESDSELLAVLKLAYGEYTLKKLNILEWHRHSRKGNKMCLQFKTILMYFFNHKRVVHC
jgi:hypothetical protein